MQKSIFDKKGVSAVVVIVLIILILLIVFAGFYLKGITGNAVLANYLNTAYATPLDVFNNNVSIFNISSSNLTAVGDIVNISVNVSINGYVYKKGYIFNQQTRRWEVFTFDQTPVENSYWIKNNASADLTINASSALQNGENYIVAYACQKDSSGAWQCGCQTKDQRNCTRWMLHTFNVSSVVAVPDTNCTSDANCSMTNGTCDILKGVCVSKLECIANSSCILNTCSNANCTDSCGNNYTGTIEPDCSCNATTAIGNTCSSSNNCGSCQGTHIRDGTLTYPFAISTCEQLQNTSNNFSANYELLKNIDCVNTSVPGASVWDSSGFTPVCNCSQVFKGNFNGNNRVISNLFINRTSTDCVGLFGTIYNITSITNLNLANFSVSGKNHVGGLVGYNWKGNVRNCSSQGFVSGVYNVGGLVGKNYAGLVESSYANVTLLGSLGAPSSVFFGGLVGVNYASGSTNKAYINNSYSMGSIIFSGTNDVVAGLTNIWNDAGLGSYSFINNSYSAVNVSAINGKGFVGGAAGIVGSSYWDVNASNKTVSLNGLGKTTVQMKNISTYTAWNPNVWNLTEGQYPKLKWQS